MPKYEYTEGRVAKDNFEEGMKALFKVSRDEVVPLKKRGKTVSSQRKPKKSDKD